MIDRVFFDYTIDLQKVYDQGSSIDFQKLDIFSLKTIFSGRIYILFDSENTKKRNFILLKTGIIDYILQFDNLISYINKGNNETFTVSSDYYSNSLNYFYSSENDNFEIHEVNDALYTITCKYMDFQKGYKKFRKKTLNELIILFPELKQNMIFNEIYQG